MSVNWKTVGIVGGGVIVIGGGFLLVKYLASGGEEKPKKKGILEKISSWLFGDKTADSLENWFDSLLSIPANIQSLIKWVAIGGGILIAILVIVFAYRMAIGSTPDVPGAMSTIAYALPNDKVLKLNSTPN